MLRKHYSSLQLIWSIYSDADWNVVLLWHPFICQPGCGVSLSMRSSIFTSWQGELDPSFCSNIFCIFIQSRSQALKEMSSSMRPVMKTKQRLLKTKRKPGRNEYRNCHVVVLRWNTLIYQGLAHTVCMELDLHNTDHKLVSLYPFSETSWTEKYEVKGFAMLGCSGSDIHTPKTFLCVCAFRSTGLYVSWSQVMVGSITPSLGGQQPETDCSSELKTNKLPEWLCKMEGGQVCLKSRAWHREWLINSGRSRRKTKLQFLQKNISQGTLSHLLKISLQGPIWRSSRSR